MIHADMDWAIQYTEQKKVADVKWRAEAQTRDWDVAMFKGTGGAGGAQ